MAEGQCLGNSLTYGGPYLGLLSRREQFVRKMPGRLVGQTVDRDGSCWVLTMQTREQHIRREKATSNICTNQGLMGLKAAVYLAALGPQGLRETAELCTRKAHYAAEMLTQIPGVHLRFTQPFFKEFTVQVRPPYLICSTRCSPRVFTADCTWAVGCPISTIAWAWPSLRNVRRRRSTASRRRWPCNWRRSLVIPGRNQMQYAL